MFNHAQLYHQVGMTGLMKRWQRAEIGEFYSSLWFHDGLLQPD
jgi:hypothetical protein